MLEIVFVCFGLFYFLWILIVVWKENYKNLFLYIGLWLLRVGVCLKEFRLYFVCIIYFYFCDNLIFFRCIFMIKIWWIEKESKLEKVKYFFWFEVELKINLKCMR